MDIQKIKKYFSAVALITVNHICGEGQIIIEVEKAIEAHKSCGHTLEEFVFKLIEPAVGELKNCPCLENRIGKKVDEELNRLLK